MDDEVKKMLKWFIPVFTIVLGLIGLFLLFYYIFPYLKIKGFLILGALSPFILALIVAILIDPLVNFLEIKAKLPRGIAVILSLVLVLCFISVFLILISSRLFVELTHLSKSLPGLYSHLVDEGWEIFAEIRSYISRNPLPVEFQQSVEENLLNILDTLRQALRKATEILINFVATLPLVFTIIIVTAVATFFISKDKEMITNYLINAIPARAVLPLNKVFISMSEALIGFLRAQTILVTMTGVQTIIGLYIIGVDYAFTIGILTAIADILPILGPGIIFIPWAVVNLLIGNIKFGLAILILYGIVITIRQILEPKIFSVNIGLHPLATLMAIFIGLRLMGVWGIFVGPLILIVYQAFKKAKA
ncbi:MAG: sporulation integral membrane protein YtvI [Clostridia bacterium]|nr:sporulation integral membrane protein YtvI [Clostridia bacterium]